MESRASSRVVPVALPSFLSTVQPLYLNIPISQRKQGLIRIAGPWCENRIPDLNFSIPGPGSRVNKVTDPGSASTSKMIYIHIKDLSKLPSSQKNGSRIQNTQHRGRHFLESGQASFFYSYMKKELRRPCIQFSKFQGHSEVTNESTAEGMCGKPIEHQEQTTFRLVRQCDVVPRASWRWKGEFKEKKVIEVKTTFDLVAATHTRTCSSCNTYQDMF